MNNLSYSELTGDVKLGAILPYGLVAWGCSGLIWVAQGYTWDTSF